MRKPSKLQILVGIVLSVAVILFTYKLILNLPITGTTLLAYIVILLVSFAFAYLSYIDLKSMEVDSTVSMILIIGLLLLNITLYFILGSDGVVTVSDSLHYSPYENLLATLILGSAFQLVVILSKETFLGQGDVRIAIIVGLIVGVSNLWLWLNLTIFSALAYGLIVAVKKHKFKGLRIPFVPFMVLGTLVILLMKF